MPSEIVRFIETSLRSILDNPAIMVSPETSLSGIEGLDSIRTVELILLVEDHYNIRMNAEDMDRMTTAASLAEIVIARAVEPALPARPAAVASSGQDSFMAIEQVEMLGNCAKITFRLTGPPGGTSVRLIHQDFGDIEARQLSAEGDCFSFLCKLDLARHRLDRCRIVTQDGNLNRAEHVLPPPARIVIGEMADGGVNRSHLAAALPEEISKAGIGVLLRRFESFGDNCEFGVFAGMLGDKSLGLFRAGGTSEWMIVPRPGRPTLASALAGAFEGFGTAADLRLEYKDGEFLCFSNKYDFCFHTGEKNPAAALPELAARQTARLRWLAEKFLEDIANPSKIFVRKSNGAETETQIIELAQAMRRHGQAWLLWVSPATPQEPPGSITIMPNRLMRVTISALSDYKRANRVDALAWLNAITAAHLVLASPVV